MTNATHALTDPSQTRPLTAIESGVLEACHEATLRQRELLPMLAHALAVQEKDVFYTWATRRCGQHGSLPGTDWAYFFHGLECDLKNQADGRFLRMDFGPKGRVDTFTMWGVLQFIMTSTTPWPEFAVLKQHLAETGQPYDQYAGSVKKMAPVWDCLEAQGMLENADPSLLDFEARHTVIGPDGISRVLFPPGTPDETRLDCAVAGRMVISPRGLLTLGV